MSGAGGPLLQRLWRYQSERFPLARHAPLILVFSGAAVGYAGQLAGRPLHAGVLAAATAAVLLQFLLMRVADEFKDDGDDRRWRPERPVPRGLVTLAELAGLGAVAAALQLTLVLLTNPAALPLLLLVWGWFLLMTAEFFRPTWLRRHLGPYALSHLVIVPLLALLAMGLLGPLPPRPGALAAFLLCTYACSGALELARKTWPPEAERQGVDSYSSRWGLRPALATWWLCLALSAGAALVAAGPSASLAALGPLLGALLLLSLLRIAGWLWGEGRPCPRSGEPLAGLSALWILVVYGGLGWWPWFLGPGSR